MDAKQTVVDLRWLGVGKAESLPWHDPSLQSFFSVQPHPALFSQFDIPARDRIVPHLLLPRDGFHRITTRSLPAPWAGTELARLPYHIERGSNSPTFEIVAITAEVFPGGFLVARVKAKMRAAQDMSLEETLTALRTLRSAKSVAVVDSVLQHVFALAGERRAALDNKVAYADYFTMRIPSSQNDMGAKVSENHDLAGQVAELLVGFPAPRKLGADVVDSLLIENLRLNQKAESELQLINSQGAVYISPVDQHYRSPHSRRLEKTTDLAVIALFARAFLSDHAELANRAPTYTRFIQEKLARIIHSPGLTFQSSFANELVWQRISQALRLPDHLADWASRNATDRRTVGWEFRVEALPTQWWLERNLCERLDPKDSSTTAAPFGSLRPATLGEFIEADRQEARRCFDVGNYRASIVMAGAAVEGILLALILRDQGPIKGKCG